MRKQHLRYCPAITRVDMFSLDTWSTCPTAVEALDHLPSVRLCDMSVVGLRTFHTHESSTNRNATLAALSIFRKVFSVQGCSYSACVFASSKRNWSMSLLGLRLWHMVRSVRPCRGIRPEAPATLPESTQARIQIPYAFRLCCAAPPGLPHPRFRGTPDATRRVLHYTLPASNMCTTSP